MHSFRWLCVRSAFGPTPLALALLLIPGLGFAFEKSAPATAGLAVRPALAAHGKLDAGLRIVLDRWADAASTPGTASLRRRESLTDPRSVFSVLASPRGGEPDVLTFIRITGAGLRESHVHDVMITREAPNYPSPV